MRRLLRPRVLLFLFLGLNYFATFLVRAPVFPLFAYLADVYVYYWLLLQGALLLGVLALSRRCLPYALVLLLPLASILSTWPKESVRNRAEVQTEVEWDFALDKRERCLGDPQLSVQADLKVLSIVRAEEPCAGASFVLRCLGQKPVSFVTQGLQLRVSSSHEENEMCFASFQLAEAQLAGSAKGSTVRLVFVSQESESMIDYVKRSDHWIALRRAHGTVRHEDGPVVALYHTPEPLTSPNLALIERTARVTYRFPARSWQRRLAVLFASDPVSRLFARGVEVREFSGVDSPTWNLSVAAWPALAVADEGDEP